jgi:hypothetical protein
MKILSKFTDYYDYSCGFFSDSTTYERTVVIERDKALLTKFQKLAERCRQITSWDRNKVIETTFKPGFVILTNKLYPFIIVSQGRLDHRVTPTSKTFYSLDQELLDLYEKEFKYFNKSKITSFFQSSMQLDLKYPIAVYCPDLNLTSETTSLPPQETFTVSMAYNVRLKDYHFPMKGQLVIQEIEMFINRYKDADSSVFDDETIMKAKGFDKQSFKH